MIEQLETIIRLLTEINNKLTPAAPPPAQRPPKKETQSQRIRRLAIEGMPEIKQRDAEKAKKKFASGLPVKKLTKKQAFHQQAVEAMSNYSAMRASKVGEKFTKEREEIELLEKELELQTQQLETMRPGKKNT